MRSDKFATQLDNPLNPELARDNDRTRVDGVLFHSLAEVEDYIYETWPGATQVYGAEDYNAYELPNSRAVVHACRLRAIEISELWAFVGLQYGYTG